MAVLRCGIFSVLLAVARGFYLPGVAVREYSDGERVEIKVNKLSSTKTQLPYDYYSLPFCKPAEIVNKIENLGEVLHGSVIQNSAYDVYMGKSDFKVLCRQELNRAKALLFHKRIKEDYRAHLILDNLPAATKMIREMPDGKTEQIHWFSIVNSLMIVLFLTGMVAMIMMRTLRRDLNRYNEAEAREDDRGGDGWKLVHGDVFRPPPRRGCSRSTSTAPACRRSSWASSRWLRRARLPLARQPRRPA